MSQQQWIKLTNKFTSRCVQCGEWINPGELVLWLKGLGIKHDECPIGMQEDETSLVILEQEDQERLGIKYNSPKESAEKK